VSGRPPDAAVDVRTRDNLGCGLYFSIMQPEWAQKSGREL
jgi:hypothetical protein